jgi:hypothetical protein
MSQQELLSKLIKFKGNVLQLVRRRLNDFKEPEIIEKDENEIADVYMEDLPLTLSRDSGPNISYYPTENSKYAKGSIKEIPRGLDRFNENHA